MLISNVDICLALSAHFQAQHIGKDCMGLLVLGPSSYSLYDALARVTGLRLASPGRNEGSELSKTAPAAVFGSQGPIASAAKSNAVEHVQIESLWE